MLTTIYAVVVSLLLFLSLWKNITGWRNLKNEALTQIKALLELLAQHQVTANQLAAQRISSDPSLNPNLAANGVQAAARKI